MKKSLDIHFRAHFGQPKPEHWPEMPIPEIPIRHAERQYYNRPGDWVIAQEFDGKNGYLFSYDLEFEAAVDIPIKIEMPDLYVVYLMGGEHDMVIYDESRREVCRLAPGRACYLYVPPGNYHAHVATGRHTVFGFYFDGGIFRDGNERKFPFLQDLIQNYRERSDQLIASVDFRIGPRTRARIQYLCDNIRKGDFDNELLIFQELHKLIQLSREKILEEETKMKKGLRIATEAQQLLMLYIEEEGQLSDLRRLEAAFPYKLATINRFHNKHFGKSLQKLRDELLLERACTLLKEGLAPTQCAYALNYSYPESFYYFFKKRMGISPQTYLVYVFKLNRTLLCKSLRRIFDYKLINFC